MVESSQNKKLLITEVPNKDHDSDSDSDNDVNDDSVEDNALAMVDEDEEEEDENEKNQYFHVQEAEPPTNYEDPYSTLPSKIVLKTIRRDIASSLKLKDEKEKQGFEKLLYMEHTEALISDAFWYFICAQIKPNKNYHAHCEFLKDRMAANYVSFTLVEDSDVTKRVKEKFFENFYNHLAQAVYQCLRTAFPKNRNQLETPETKRQLLNTFSYLFTGMEIHSAKFSNWNDGNRTAKASGENKKQADDSENLSLADIQRKGVQKNKSKKVIMKYSPLVERYLMTHKYETMNNVQGWKMLLTQRTEVQKEQDKKFAVYKKMAEQATENCSKLMKEYEEKCAEIKAQLIKNERGAKKHIETLKEGKLEKITNGGYLEYSNMCVSIFNSEHMNYIDPNNVR